MITKFLFKLDEVLRGEPEELLTLGLIALGGLAIGVALFGTPKEKAALTVWFVFP